MVLISAQISTGTYVHYFGALIVPPKLYSSYTLLYVLFCTRGVLSMIHACATCRVIKINDV